MYSLQLQYVRQLTTGGAGAVGCFAQNSQQQPSMTCYWHTTCSKTPGNVSYQRCLEQVLAQRLGHLDEPCPVPWRWQLLKGQTSLQLVCSQLHCHCSCECAACLGPEHCPGPQLGLLTWQQQQQQCGRQVRQLRSWPAFQLDWCWMLLCPAVHKHTPGLPL